jgi:hypothetical protein
MLRRFLTSLAAASPFLLAGCHPSFPVTVTGQTTVNASPIPVSLIPLDFAGFGGIDLSQTQEFKNQGITKNEVQSVKLTGVKLTIASPSGANFDFLTSLSFDVSAQGEPQKEVASLASVPRSATELDLTVANVELVPYVTAPSMSVTSNAQGELPPQNTTINATMVFDVEPKIF